MNTKADLPRENVPEKLCRNCGITKPLTDFYPAQRNPRRGGHCKHCYDAGAYHAGCRMDAPVVTLSTHLDTAQKVDAMNARRNNRRKALRRVLGE